MPELPPIPHPDQLAQVAAQLRDATSRNLPPATILTLLLELCHGHKPFGINRSFEQIWYRARIAPDSSGFANVRSMLYPPSGSPSYGRASLPRARVLYAGWNGRLALEEIGAKAGDYVQMIRLRVRSPLMFPCIVIGDRQSIFNSGKSIINSLDLEKKFREDFDSLPPRALADIYVDSVLSEIFRRPITTSSDYSTSAAIATELMENYNSGLIFPSVRTSHAINLAVRAGDFDRYFEVLGADVLRVRAYPGYGIYVLDELKSSWKVDSSGDFDWSQSTPPTRKLDERGGVLIAPEFVGWHA